MADLSFNEQAINCIIRSVDGKFGEGVRQVLFWKFQEVTKLGIQDIPRKPEAFVECMRMVFGAGSASIERAIVEGLVQEFKIVVPGDSGVVAALQAAKSKRLREDLTEG